MMSLSIKILLQNDYKSYWIPTATQAIEDITMLELFLENGMKVNARLAGMLPLSIAAKNGNIELVKLLLEKGANVNLVDSESRRPPFEVACEAASFEAAYYIFKNGMDVCFLVFYYYLIVLYFVLFCYCFIILFCFVIFIYI